MEMNTVSSTPNASKEEGDAQMDLESSEQCDASNDQAGSDSVMVENASSSSVMEQMLHRIADSDGHFKHQQRGEPDLSHAEKFKIAADILRSKPSVFLTQYGKYLEEVDLVYFEEDEKMKSDYIISFMLAEIRKELDTRKNKLKVRNRRYEAMQELMEQGEYFSEEEMKYRDPLLYEQMVGQYVTEEEAAAKVDHSDLRISSIIFRHMQLTEDRLICQMQQQIEEGQMEESESDEEEEEETGEEETIPDQPQISDAEKMMLRNDFIRTMQLRFLNGEDEGFDYSKVDTNVEYDSLNIREHDEEEKYFDEEEPETVRDDSPGAPHDMAEGEEEDYETYNVDSPQKLCTQDMEKLHLKPTHPSSEAQEQGMQSSIS